MTMSGWVKLHRDIEENDLYFAEPFTKAQAWIDLFLNANHKPGSFMVRGNVVELKRGQLGWSEITMAKRWRWSRDKVRRFLGMMETRQQIIQHKTFISTVITIVNYDKFQEDETANKTAKKQQKNSKQDINNNGKNENNEKNIIIGEPQGDSPLQQCLDLFYQFNPLFNFGNKTERSIMDELITKWGIEKAMGTIKYALSIQNQKFSPTITKPSQLKAKMGELLRFYSQHNGASTAHVVATNPNL